MKSEKAEEYIEEHILRYSYDGDFWSKDAESAVEIAEEEAEERHEKALHDIAKLCKILLHSFPKILNKTPIFVTEKLK